MARKVKLNELDKAINEILMGYSDEVISDTKDVVDEVTQKALSIVKSNAPVEEKSKRKGKYKRSLKKKTVYESATEKRNVIYAGEYQLAHLLEKGHAKVNGGRTKAQPHFQYGNDYVLDELPKKIKKKIGGK